MNANELADWIENGAPFGKYETAKQAVIMLRQQQAEIEKLTKLMNFWHDSFNELRTHPAKTLTDEEIEEIISECTMTKFLWNQPLQEFDAIGFARAILRKAKND
jgi:hypothetical protein